MVEWLNANQGVVDFALTLLFILTTLVVMRASFRANEIAEATLSQMREERVQERRPYVYFELEFTNRYRIVNFKLVNKGKGAAKNVRAIVEQEVPLSNERALSKLAIVRPIPFLAPSGGHFTEYADLARLFFNENEDRTITGRVEYESTDGQKFSTPIDINVKSHSHRGLVFRREMKDLVKVVDELVREMERKL